MKHEALFRRLLTELHEDWMDDEDKAQFDAEMIATFGADLDRDLEIGIKSGLTIEQQEQLVRQLFRICSR